MTELPNWAQATPVCAFLFAVTHVAGAPDADLWGGFRCSSIGRLPHFLVLTGWHWLLHWQNDCHFSRLL